MKGELKASERGYKKVYAVDFDGTLAVTRFPDILRPIPETFRYCKRIKENGDILILWTCRCGEDLEMAVDYCRNRGLQFDYVNENVPKNTERFGNDCRKIFADVYIDDKALSIDREKAWKKRQNRQRVNFILLNFAEYITIIILMIYIVTKII